MNQNYTQCVGTPFQGIEKENLIQFLQMQSLEYDENITYTFVLKDEGTIIGTGSFHGNVIKCVAIDSKYQGQNLLSLIMTHLVGKLFEQKVYHYFGFTKPKNKRLFGSMGLYPVAETKDVLLMENKKNGLKKYVDFLKNESDEMKKIKKENKDGEGIGAIVANCNPFTYGHRYLMEKAAKQCRWLHIFVLSSEQGLFTANERFEMVKEGTKDLQNVMLHRSSDYLISPAVFPTYFMKDKVHAFSMNCMLDLKIFSEIIARQLKINKRFVGTEPTCSVTREYNHCLKNTLPDYGIEVIELERMKKDGVAISASKVRQALLCHDELKIKELVPKTTMDCCKRKGEIRDDCV